MAAADPRHRRSRSSASGLARSIYGGERGLASATGASGERFPAVHRLLVNKYYVDEIYDRLIVRPLAALSRFFWKGVDTLVIDGAINAGACLTELAGEVGRLQHHRQRAQLRALLLRWA